MSARRERPAPLPLAHRSAEILAMSDCRHNLPVSPLHHEQRPCYNRDMNPKITPEIRTALSQHPHGPIRLNDETAGEPVFVVRLGDIADLQATVDEQIRQKLAEADADIDAGNVAPWDADEIKQRGRARLHARNNGE